MLRDFRLVACEPQAGELNLDWKLVLSDENLMHFNIRI